MMMMMKEQLTVHVRPISMGPLEDNMYIYISCAVMCERPCMYVAVILFSPDRRFVSIISLRFELEFDCAPVHVLELVVIKASI